MTHTLDDRLQAVWPNLNAVIIWLHSSLVFLSSVQALGQPLYPVSSHPGVPPPRPPDSYPGGTHLPTYCTQLSQASALGMSHIYPTQIFTLRIFLKVVDLGSAA